jgi:hypothetical protein
LKEGNSLSKIIGRSFLAMLQEGCHKSQDLSKNVIIAMVLKDFCSLEVPPGPVLQLVLSLSTGGVQ